MTTRRHIFFFVLLIFILIAPAQAQNVFIVDDAGDAGDSNLADNVCDTGAGVCTLRAAIEQAVSGDIIVFSQTLVPLGSTQTITVGSELIINKDLTVDGEEDDRITLNGGNANRVFHLTTDSILLTLQFLTLANGNGTEGGAIYVQDGALALTDVTIRDSDATSGGGVHVAGGADSFTGNNVTFINNDATGSGGAIYQVGGTMGISNAVFTTNTASIDGGAVYSTVNTSFSASTFNLNVAASGGAIFASGTSNTLGISTSTFQQNNATGGFGGAIHNGQVATVTRSSFASNTATGVGGAVAVNGSGATLTATNSTFSSNASTGGGSSAVGGGIGLVNGGTFTGNQVTIADNTATSGGGLGISIAGAATLRNSVLARNSAGTGPDCFVNQFVATEQGRNFISNTADCGFSDGTITGADSGLSNNTIGQPAYYTIDADSPLLNRAVDCNVATDQPGTSRTSPPGGECDLGAFERTAGFDAVPATLSPSTVTFTEGETSSAVTVTLDIFPIQTVTVNFTSIQNPALCEIRDTGGNVITSVDLDETNWNTSTVQVFLFAADNADEDGDRVCSFSSTLVSTGDVVYDGVTGPGLVGNIIDDDSVPPLPDIISFPAATEQGGETFVRLSLLEGSPQNIVYQLSEEPSNLITITFLPLDAECEIVSGSPLTLSPTNWDQTGSLNTVQVRAIQDGEQEPDHQCEIQTTVTVDGAARDGYDTPDILGSIPSDLIEPLEVNITPLTATLFEGENLSVSVTANDDNFIEEDPIVVNIAIAPADECTLSNTVLTLDEDNGFDQTVTIRVSQDNDDEEGQHQCVATFTPDNGTAIQQVIITIQDTVEDPDILVNGEGAGAPVSVNLVEGGSAETVTITTVARPTASITFDIVATDGECLVNNGTSVSVQLAPEDFDTGATFTVLAVDDFDRELDPHSCTVAITASNNVAVASVEGVIDDNDENPQIITDPRDPDFLDLIEGTSANLTVRFTAEPLAPATVTVASEDPTQCTVEGLPSIAVTLSGAGGVSGVPVSINAVADDVEEGTHFCTLQVSATGFTINPVTVRIIDEAPTPVTPEDEEETETATVEDVDDPDETQDTEDTNATSTPDAAQQTAAAPDDAAPTPEPATEVPLGVVVSDEVRGLACRSGPYLGASLVSVAFPDTIYPVFAQNQDENGSVLWYLIDVDGSVCWVSGVFASPNREINLPNQGSVFDSIPALPPSGLTAVVISDEGTTLHRRPSLRAAVVLEGVPNGAAASILARTIQEGVAHWYLVNFNGVVGWMPAADAESNGSEIDLPRY